MPSALFLLNLIYQMALTAHPPTFELRRGKQGTDAPNQPTWKPALQKNMGSSPVWINNFFLQSIGGKNVVKRVDAYKKSSLWYHGDTWRLVRVWYDLRL